MTPGQIENLFVYEDRAAILKDILGSYKGPWQLSIGKDNDGVGYLRLRVPKGKGIATPAYLSRWEKEPTLILRIPTLKKSDETGFLGIVANTKSTRSPGPCCKCRVVHWEDC